MKRQDRESVRPAEVCRGDIIERPVNPAPDAQAVWTRLVNGIRRGDPRAGIEFVKAYSQGVELLFRRTLGAVETGRLADEALAGAIDEIRRGWIQHPRDLAHFLRDIRGRDISSRTGNGGSVLSSSEMARVRQKAERLELALQAMEPRQRDWLRRYYLDGEPVADIVTQAGVTVAEFEALQRRLVASARIERKQPEREIPKLVMRAASGGD